MFGVSALAERGVGEPPLLSMVDIEKCYGPQRVLAGVQLSVSSGEIIGLLGANGAGKTTLLKVLAGIVAPSQGSMVVDGHDIVWSSYKPTDAWKHGISVVHQEFALCTNLAVWENWSLLLDRVDRQPRQSRVRGAANALEAVFPGNGISPRANVSALSLAERQMVEIARAVSHPELKLLVMDEPTSALSGESGATLQGYLKGLVQHQVSVIYVTHKLDEILRLADRLVVLRNGEVCWSGAAREASREQLVELLGGKTSEESGARSEQGAEGTKSGLRPAEESGATATARASEEDAAVWVRGLSAGGLEDINMVVKRAEMVGLAGLEGAGQREVLHALFRRGRGSPRGTVGVLGAVSYVAGDREREGIFDLWDIYHNILIGTLRVKSVVRGGLVRWGKVDRLVDHWFRHLDIAARDATVDITDLSGGNQQKVLIARAFASEAQVLLLDDPTRGVDVATKRAVYSALEEARAAGRTIIVYSTEDAEFQYCDRVYVFAQGRISGQLSGRGISGPEIVRLSYARLEEATSPSSIGERSDRETNTGSGGALGAPANRNGEGTGRVRESSVVGVRSGVCGLATAITRHKASWGARSAKARNAERTHKGG